MWNRAPLITTNSVRFSPSIWAHVCDGWTWTFSVWSVYSINVRCVSVAFESSRASFPVAAACRVKWIDMHYLITCLLCTLLLKARSPDLILAHNTHLAVPVQGCAKVGPDFRCIYS